MKRTFSSVTAWLAALTTLIAAGCGGDAGTSAGPPSVVGDGSTTTGGEVPASAGLPPVPLLPHVRAVVRGSSAIISFDPVAGAKDYRAYLLPQKSDVRLAADGSLDGVDHAVYRCAGRRAAAQVWVDGDAGPDKIPNSVFVDTRVDDQTVAGYRRPLAEATLGHVFQDPQPDTIPIHAVGDPAPAADNFFYGVREPETRGKRYVTDASPLVAAGWRDDGIAFYAPASPSSHACGASAPVLVHTVDHDDSSQKNHLFYTSAGEIAARGAGTDAFLVCPEAVAGSSPLMRTFYELGAPGGSYGGEAGHDELSVGAERFARARCQGSTFGPCADAPQSLWEIQWSNVTAPSTLVVEALDGGCPFQGLLGATDLASLPVGPGDDNNDTSLKNDPLSTFAEIQARVPHGEVFINGQGDAAATPHPIARAAVAVAPAARPTMDFASDFAGHPEAFTERLTADGQPDCGLTPDLRTRAGDPDTCDGAHRLDSPTYDMLALDMNDQRYTAGTIQGELWTGYSGGKIRVTPKGVTASMSDTSFLHAAMEASSFSTGRRYPQIIVSQDDMITSQWLLERTPPGSINTNVHPALYLHPIDAGVGRPVLEIEVCNQRPWQVNNHCPWFLLEKHDPPTRGAVGDNNPHPDLFDRLQDDRTMRLDLFLSTQRAYVFVDSRPYACVDLAHRKATGLSGEAIVPAPAPPPAGPVTVTFGDVQYHAGAESGYFEIFSPFHLDHMLYETVRHFDYLGFSSDVAAPAWDEAASPCITQMYQGGDAGTQTPEEGL